MISAEQYDQIEAYLFGQMNETARQAFEAELAQNKALAAELALHKLEHASMQLALEGDFREQMKGWQSELVQTPEAPKGAPQIVKMRRLNWRIMAAAATVLLIAGFFGQRWANANYGDNALLGETDFFSISIRGGQVRSNLDQANSALNNQDYQQVFALLDQIDTLDYETEMLRAGAAYGLKDYAGAIQYTQTAIEKARQPLEKQEAEWKLAMLYIAARDDAKAKEILDTIAENPDNEYAGDAQAITKKLNSTWRKVTW